MDKSISRAEFEKLKKEVDQLKHSASTVSKKTPRKPSEYNEFISTEIIRIKKENSSIDHKDAFRKAVESWNHRDKSKPATATTTMKKGLLRKIDNKTKK